MFGLKRRFPAPATEDGERIYAIGDVHGRVDLLRDLLARIDAFDADLPEPSSRHVVLLGDIVDRGPASREVIGLLHATAGDSDRMTVLQGNHEHMMVMALTGHSRVMLPWLRMGGDETLRSFGVDPKAFKTHEELIEAALDVVPGEWINWLRMLPTTARSGDYFFCHAGVRPGVPIDRQKAEDILWIRQEFLRSRRSHGVMVVHGHSVETKVEMRPNRIGIDTGAYRTGVLTALYLEGTERGLIVTQEAQSPG